MGCLRLQILSKVAVDCQLRDERDRIPICMSHNAYEGHDLGMAQPSPNDQLTNEFLPHGEKLR